MNKKELLECLSQAERYITIEEIARAIRIAHKLIEFEIFEADILHIQEVGFE